MDIPVKHKCNIWVDKMGNYLTFVPDCSAKKGRRMIKRKNYDKLVEYLQDYYLPKSYVEKVKYYSSNSKQIEEILADNDGNCYKVERLKLYLMKKLEAPSISQSPLYHVYNAMVDRCYNPKSFHYCNYGQKNVNICDEWLNPVYGRYRFMSWALDNGYKQGLSIDRIDSNGDYEPNNCRWATLIEQANNKKSTVRYEDGNEMLTIAELSRKYDLPDHMIYKRVALKGMSVSDAISEIRAIVEKED